MGYVESVKVTQRLLDQFKANEATLKKNLDETDETITKVNDLHDKALKGLNEELALVERAMRELDRQGISRPPK
jgi:ABC-type phosphate transport system auxiliary subunit